MATAAVVKVLAAGSEVPVEFVEPLAGMKVPEGFEAGGMSASFAEMAGIVSKPDQPAIDLLPEKLKEAHQPKINQEWREGAIL